MNRIKIYHFIFQLPHDKFLALLLLTLLEKNSGAATGVDSRNLKSSTPNKQIL